ADIMHKVYAHRKDLKQARFKVAMKKLALQNARGNLMPKLDLVMNSTFKGNKKKDFADALAYSKDNKDLYIGLEFEMPLTPRAFRTVIEKAVLEYSKAEADLDNLKSEIRIEIAELIRDFNYREKNVIANQKAVQLMEKRRQEYRKNYLNGQIELQQYVQAVDTLRNWQKTYMSSLFNYNIAKAKLEIAQGIFLELHGINQLDTTAEVK
ncbi:MAG TPA: TolC family protein, partial [Spirochaetota bacterium]|nr:TolC family protein [Spirochaetota bacterium]